MNIRSATWLKPATLAAVAATGFAYCLWPDDTLLVFFTSSLATAGLVFLQPSAPFQGPRP